MIIENRSRHGLTVRLRGTQEKEFWGMAMLRCVSGVIFGGRLAFALYRRQSPESGFSCDEAIFVKNAG